ncbi:MULTISPECIES: sigma-54 interaction domain-containing protein [Niastella]|uniref:Sigma-54-dependent Fis family transcriptional regulator n=1 Tax=Niastella soli TaxID=2821487 RepID=A0ABS3YRH4_9BACT|nr:sigma-54 dependent transcriptional regulator [Niastella soli]MBO9200483.1 sigma-54-dependent Fis family transcriptional regulator [Niastella soli]
MRYAKESTCLSDEFPAILHFPDIIGNSREIRQTLHLVAKVAPTACTTLILGETGTGKELIAKAIHDNSPRRSKTMVKVNCAALPANLIESELFGHERGSFTGAFERRIGKFELAHNGTLFLDEIGELPLELQVKLLRALQEKEIERIGGKGSTTVDTRIIAATNRDLEKEVAEGRFRADLYYRLNIFPINLPSLRNRRDDIPSLVHHFICKLTTRTGKEITTISKYALKQLMNYSWPGNIRELEHVIERSMLLAEDKLIHEIQLPSNKEHGQRKTTLMDFTLKTIEENERDHILNTLNYCKGRISGSHGAAEFLGVPPSTLSSKLKRLGIGKNHFVV